MREDKKIYVIVGMFVIAMIAVLILWIAILSGRTGPTDDYYIVYDNVMGLETGVEILYEGFPVGLIEKITPEERNGRRSYRLDVSVKRDWPIPDDSKAEITAPGLLSAVVIDIQAGESESLLPPDSEIPGIEATDVFAVVDELSSFIDESLTPLLASISDGTPEIISNLETFTTDMNDTLGRVNELLKPINVKRVAQILENLESTSADFASVASDLNTVRAQIEELLTQANTLLDRNEGQVGQAMADLNHSLEAVARHIDGITANIETTTQNMNEFSRQIRENPGVIIRGRETDATGTN